MIVHFIEVSNSFNWGKFMLARLEPAELDMRSALPGYEDRPLFSGRKFDHDVTLVVDLQTGEGAAFPLAGSAHADLNDKHRVWVCPMFEPFLHWLYDQGLGRGAGDIRALPRYVDLPDAESSLQGYRREGAPESEG